MFRFFFFAVIHVIWMIWVSGKIWFLNDGQISIFTGLYPKQKAEKLIVLLDGWLYSRRVS